MAGSSSPAGGNTSFALARYRRNGILDSAFGVGGRVSTDLGLMQAEARGLALQGDGRIVAGGAGGSPGGLEFVVARFLAK